MSALNKEKIAKMINLMMEGKTLYSQKGCELRFDPLAKDSRGWDDRSTTSGQVPFAYTQLDGKVLKHLNPNVWTRKWFYESPTQETKMDYDEAVAFCRELIMSGKIVCICYYAPSTYTDGRNNKYKTCHFLDTLWFLTQGRNVYEEWVNVMYSVSEFDKDGTLVHSHQEPFTKKEMVEI